MAYTHNYHSSALSITYLCIQRAFIAAIFVAAVVSNAAACNVKVGVVPQFESRQTYAIWTPLLSALEERTKCKFELKRVRSMLQFEERLHSGAYDMAYVNPYQLVMTGKKEGYHPIVRSSTRMLNGIIVVPTNSPITHIEQLRNATVAFPSANAFASSMLLRSELLNDHDIHVKPRYVKNHSSVYLFTAKEVTAAGGGALSTLEEQNIDVQNRLRVLYRSRATPAHAIVVHPRLGHKLAAKLQAALVNISKTNPDLMDNIPMPKAMATQMKDYRMLHAMRLEKLKLMKNM